MNIWRNPLLSDLVQQNGRAFDPCYLERGSPFAKILPEFFLQAIPVAKICIVQIFHQLLPLAVVAVALRAFDPCYLERGSNPHVLTDTGF